MLWPFGFRYQSNLDGILDKKNITLEELLADDDYKNELKCGNEKLVNFLCLPSSLHKLIHLCLRMPPETASDTNKTEVPSLACDTLCRDHEDRVGRALLTDASYIQSILDTLILTAPLPPIMGFYLNRVLRSMIMNDAPSFFQKLQMLDPQTYVPLFLAHLTTSYVPDLIVTLQRGPPQSERINPQPLSNKPMSVSNDDWWLRGDFLKQSIYLLHNPRTSDSVRTTLLYVLIEVVRSGMQFSDDSMVQNATKTPSPPAPSGSQWEPSHTEPEHDCEPFTPPIVHHDRSLTDEFLKLDSVRAVVSRIDDEKGNDERVNAAMIDYFIALIETACSDQERAMGFVNQLSPLMGIGHDVGGFRGGSATPLLVRSTLRTQNNGHLEPDPQSRFEVSEEVSRTLYKLPPDGTPLEVVCEYLPKLIQLTVVGDSSPATRLRLPGLFIPVRAGAVRVRILSLLALLVTRRRRQCFDTILIHCETFRKCFDAFVAFHNNSFVHYSITEILLGTLQQKEEPMLRAQVLDMCELIVEYACQQYTSPQPRFQNFSYLIILCAELRGHVDPEVLKKHPHHATFLHDMIQQELNKQNTPLESEAKPLTLPNFTAPAPKPEEPSEVPFFRRYDSVENIAREMENLTTVSATSKSEMCNNSCTAISSDAEEDIISLDDLNEGVFASGGFRARADTEHHSGPETHSLVVSAQEEPASGSVGCTHLQEFAMEKNEKLANSKQGALPNNEAKADRDTCKPLGWSCSRVDMKEELLLDYNSFDYWKL